MADPRARTWSTKEETRIFCAKKARKYPKNGGDMSKGHRSEFKGRKEHTTHRGLTPTYLQEDARRRQKEQKGTTSVPHL